MDAEFLSLHLGNEYASLGGHDPGIYGLLAWTGMLESTGTPTPYRASEGTRMRGLLRLWHRFRGHRKPVHFDPEYVAEMKHQIEGASTGKALMRKVGRVRDNMRKNNERKDEHEDHEVPEG